MKQEKNVNLGKKNIYFSEVDNQSRSNTSKFMSESSFDQSPLIKKRSFEEAKNTVSKESAAITKVLLTSPGDLNQNSVFDDSVDEPEQIFKNLFNILINFFLDQEITKSDYQRCSLIEKQVFKLIIQRKLGLDPCSLLMKDEDDVDSFTELKFTTLRNIRGRISCKRSNEIKNYVLLSFMKQEIISFKKNDKCRSFVVNKSQLEVKKLYFMAYFKNKISLEEHMKTYISIFSKKSKKIEFKKYFGKELGKYSKNFKHQNMISKIKENKILVMRFKKFLDEKSETNIFKNEEDIIRNKVKKFIKSMETKMNEMSENDKNAYLSYFQTKITNPKCKLPMCMTDIREYSKQLLLTVSKS
jgi:hypothetical protein